MTEEKETCEREPEQEKRPLRLTGSTKPPPWERHPALTGAIVALLAAALSASVGFFGAYMGSNASVRVVEMQNEAEDKRRSQDQRDVVYRDYLQAANDYWLASISLLQQGSEPRSTEATGALVSKFMTARAEYQGTINEITVHGSRDAWNAHENVAATLPPSLGTSPGTTPLTAQDVANESDFTRAYNAFLRVRCREAVPISIGGCASE